MHGPVEFELLMADPTYEIVAQHWAANLKLIGVSVHLRTVDFPQYTTRTGKFDFDTIVGVIPLVPSPGTEMNSLWGSKYADIQNSFNWSGIKSRAVDALINDMIAARTRPELETAAHALDRVLLWSFYSIPHYGQGGKFNVAYWDRFGRPAKSAWFGFPFQTTWWIDPQKNAALRAARGNTN